VTKRGLWIGALICAAALAGPALAARPPLPASVTSHLLGPKLVRGEVVIKRSTGAYDYRLDRGRLSKRYAAGSLTLLEKDGNKVQVAVSPTARVFVNGFPSTLRRLRLGMYIAVWHGGDQAASTVLANTRRAPKLPNTVSATLFGPRLIRAEIALQDTTLHDYRLDRGRIKQVTAFSLVLRELDGTEVTIEVAPTAHVKVNGQNVGYVQLRKGMMATTMRDGDAPADQVFATRK
jgi:hypothetical protein